MNRSLGVSLGFIGALVLLPACNGCRGGGPHPSASASSVAISPPPIAASTRAFMIPSGPPLAVLPGKGIGPVRFGATVATIERLMGGPCQYRYGDRCVYLQRAVEFVLTDGAVSEIRVHRRQRPNGQGQFYGMFNGATLSGFTVDMLPSAADELLGKPLEVTKVDSGGPAGTVEVRKYEEHLTLELDRLPTGKVVVGAMILGK